MIIIKVNILLLSIFNEVMAHYYPLLVQYCMRVTRLRFYRCLDNRSREQVCWLSVYTTRENVKEGVWEPTIKINCDNVRSFNALWSIKVTKNSFELLNESFHCNYARDEGGRFLLQHEGQWIRLVWPYVAT